MNIWQIKETEKICVLDLDDVLSKSSKSWLEYLNLKLNKNFTNLNTAKSFVSYYDYKEIKCDYRHSNAKLDILPIKDASKFTQSLKRLNYIIIILTRRPLYIHKNLFNLTQLWLNNNNILYDVLYFEDKKHLKIFSEIENIKFAIEDNRYIANTLGKFGIKVYLLNNIYNKGSLNINVFRINSLMEALKDE